MKPEQNRSAPDFNHYEGLPPLAGLTTFKEAEKVGYGVDDNVRYLKRYHYGLKRFHQILISRIAATPLYGLTSRKWGPRDRIAVLAGSP